MSTGLTYVTLIDSASSDPQQGSFIQVFSSYQEAFKFGEWYVTLVTLQISGSVGANVAIWTSGPNKSGYWAWNGTEITFIDY